MRGIEAAMYIYEQCSRGAIVSETLRSLGNRISPTDRTLAAALSYAVARRLSLWEYLRNAFMLPAPEKFSTAAQDAVLVGTAGIMTLKNFAPAVLISSLVDWTKKKDFRGSRVVNAVLRRVIEHGAEEVELLKRNTGLEALCLVSGFPQWAANRLCSRYGDEEGRRLVTMSAGGASLSLRLAPDAPRGLSSSFEKAGIKTYESPLPECIRLEGTHLPSTLPGYREGWITPQSESSVAVGSEAAEFDGDFFLDMCAGRGVKTGQIAQLRPDARIEGWDLSSGRTAAAVRDMQRLRVDNTTFRTGDALELSCNTAPDAILVDAPCSGSGTWRRHPEGKWRLSPSMLADMSSLQKDLLERALLLVKQKGRVLYSTCSLFAEENEDVVKSVLVGRSDIREVEPTVSDDFQPRSHGFASRPENPWTDGFYIVVLEKV